MKKPDLLSGQSFQAYMNECIIFVADIASKLLDRSPLGAPKSKGHCWFGSWLAWEKNESDSLTFAQVEDSLF